MSNSIPNSESNQLITGLPEQESRRLLLLCEPVDLIFGAILCDVQVPMQHAYFPLSGQISLVTTSSDHQPLGIAMTGNEGVQIRDDALQFAVDGHIALGSEDCDCPEERRGSVRHIEGPERRIYQIPERSKTLFTLWGIGYAQTLSAYS